MSLIGAEFNFDDTEFNANAFDDEVLDVQDGIEINTDFMDIDDPNEISMNVSIQNKSVEEVSREVESTLIDLLESKDQDIILAITGESHESSNILDHKVMDQFSSLYTTAVQHNPGIRWYAKFAKMLNSNKFSVGDTGLTLKMAKSVFKKAVMPFLGDFKGEFKESSPIVSLVYSMADSLKDANVQEQLARAMSQEGKEADAGQFDVASIDTEDAQLAVEDVKVGEVNVDDAGGFGNTVVKKTESPNISLQDLANKTVAEHFIEEGELDFDGIRDKLAEQGFAKARINEILGIVKFIDLNKSMDSRVFPEGNRGAGEINFDFM